MPASSRYSANAHENARKAYTEKRGRREQLWTAFYKTTRKPGVNLIRHYVQANQ